MSGGRKFADAAEILQALGASASARLLSQAAAKQAGIPLLFGGHGNVKCLCSDTHVYTNEALCIHRMYKWGAHVFLEMSMAWVSCIAFKLGYTNGMCLCIYGYPLEVD